ncbi:hypothetical protein [Mucilaginibacter phyllosphaerae]
MIQFISIYILVYLLIFLISVLIMRWVFRIDQSIEYQRLQYNILLKIAHKLGVDEKPAQQNNTDPNHLDDTV